MRKIIKMFDRGNVLVSGLRGTGKDMLFANVVARRKLPYVSNTDYGGMWIPFKPELLDCHNTYEDFISGRLHHYDWPYEDGVDIYVGDLGIYFPSQYQGELCKKYGYMATTQALTRHLGACNFHGNAQTLNRIWDKIREQGDQYITCNWCKVIFGIVIQKVTIYEKYDSAVNRVPVFCLPRPLLNPDRIQLWTIQKQNYQISHGNVKSRILIYRNKSKYNTRIFKEMLANA